MLTQTTPPAINPAIVEPQSSTHDNKHAELTALTSYFELLSQIDARLQIEDPEYRATYYPGN